MPKASALLILNPAAGMRHARREDLDDVLASLRRTFELDTAECSISGPTCGDLTRDAVAGGRSAVIVAGGDGTVQDAAAALLDTDVTLGILPFGSFMNIARGLGIPFDAAEAARVIVRGRVRRADVGEVNGRVFFESAGVGVDADAFGAARAAERGRWRTALRRAIRFATRQTHRVVVQSERAEVSFRALQVLVLNSPYYAWSFEVTGGDMHDGRLDVAVFPRMGRRELIWSLLRLRHDPRVEVAPVVLHEPWVRIAADGPLTVHADGRDAGSLPAEFRCRAGALAIYAP